VLIFEYASATFTATATPAAGTPTPTAQWQISTNGGATYTDIPGATSTSYTLAYATRSDGNNRYRAVFTNTAGTVTTAAATLTVVPLPTAPPAPGGENPATPGTDITTIALTSPATTTAGLSTTIQGTVRPLGTVHLFADTQPATTFTLLATTTADASGHYTFHIKLTRNTKLGVESGGLSSTFVTVHVRSTLTETAIKTGPRTYLFTGTVTPHRAHQLVTIYFTDTTGTHTAGRGYTTSAGRYTITHTFTTYGHHTYTTYATVTADTTNATNNSTRHTITTTR
jgi:hypothetical protein